MVDRVSGWLADRGDQVVNAIAEQVPYPLLVVAALVVLVLLMRHFFPGGYRW